MFNVPKLQFAPEKEIAYRRSILRRVVLVSRIGLGVGAIAIPAFIANDLLFDPNAISNTLPWRLAMGVMNGIASAMLFTSRIQNSPATIRLMILVLFLSYSAGLVLISAGHENGFVINTPGYVQVMMFIPIVCFSFLQALGVMTGMAIVSILGAMIFGASDIELANLMNWLLGSIAFALGAAFFVDRVSRRSFELEQELNLEKARADDLLLNILPPRIAERLKNNEERIADFCPCVTVLFADIAGFTALSRSLKPHRVVELLNDLFSRFDALADTHDVEKIKTIGDGYMAVAGLKKSRGQEQAAAAVAGLALDMQTAFSEFVRAHDLDLALRIGVHSGPAVAGVIGSNKIAFDLWGDTVNIASRLESGCPPGAIQISCETANLIKTGFVTEDRGEIDIPGHQRRQVLFLTGNRP